MVFIERVVLRNYKSIAACDVELGRLTFLVGRNGAGKSNFLDALRLIADALINTLSHALRERGGINEVRRRSGGHPTHFGLRVEFRLHDESKGHYSFTIAAKSDAGYEVQEEECLIQPPATPPSYYRVKSGNVEKNTVSPFPVAAPDRLYLVNASGLSEFRPVYDALSKMCFYNLSPDRIRDLQDPDPGKLLVRDGRNLASVLRHIESNNKPLKALIEEYLAKVIPGTEGIHVRDLGHKETIEFRQEVSGSHHPWRFLAANMSDGTLRALAILVALLQARNGIRDRPSLVGIEEPEIALHPAAAGVLLDSFRDAVETTQVVITSHSPDLLDDSMIDAHSLLAVVLERGETRIGPLDESDRNVMKEHLYTAGELLRLDQLRPDPSALPSQDQLNLFTGLPKA